MAKRRICVLQSCYEGSNTEMAGMDPYRVPEIHDKEGRYEWSHAYIKKATAVQQIRDLVRSRQYDVFFNLCDGAFDEDRAGKEVVDALERYGCAYTGANPVFYEPSKELMKKMAYYHGLDTPPWAFMFDINMQDDDEATKQVTEAVAGLDFPLIVKHFNGYSSVGMGKDCKVADVQQLMTQVRKFVSSFGGALIEQFIPGREFTVLVVEQPGDQYHPHTLVPVECNFAPGEDFKHFDLKWKEYENIGWVALDESKEAALGQALRQAAAAAFIALQGCSFGRCDFRVDHEGRVYFLEINPNCGIFYPADEMGSADIILTLDTHMQHMQFIDHIIECGLKRQQAKVMSKVTETRYKHGVGYGMYATRDITPGEVVIVYEEKPHVLVTRSHVATNFGPEVVPGPSPADVSTSSTSHDDNTTGSAEGALSQQSPEQLAVAQEGEAASGPMSEATTLDILGLRKKWFKEYAYPVSDEVWVTWSDDPEDWLPLNHSCDPNTWLNGLDLVARRHIKKGEQVAADYATFCVHNMKDFACACGAASCRGWVRGTDYLADWVDQVYGQHVSPYVASKRAVLKQRNNLS